MVFGNAQITTQAMQFCLRQRIPIYLLSARGRYFGVVDSFDTDPVLLQREQFRRADEPDFCLDLARRFVHGKIANSRIVLQRQSRKREAPALNEAARRLKGVLQNSEKAQSLDELRGFEGNAARIYFAAVAATLDASWRFKGRNRQPPLDPVNAMLSYGYTLLFYNIYSLLRARGLNPHVGYLHPLRAGHPALASDLVEEFRAIVVDAVVWSLAFNMRLSPSDFVWPQREGEGCLLNEQARRVFIRQMESKLNAPIRHPLSGLKLDYRRCMEHQVQLLAAVIRGTEPHYQAMVLR
jgi:CRISPR-associated protein Cas1